MTELILHMNNYSITGAITAYQSYPYKIQMGYQFTSKCHEILQNYSPVCPVYTIKISESNHKPMIY